MRRDARIAAAVGLAVLAHAVYASARAGDDASATTRASIALRVIIAFACNVYAAVRGTEAFRPMRVERTDVPKPYDEAVSDFDAFAHRGRAVRAFTR